MPCVTVSVVSICGAACLRRCLDALAGQASAPPFDIVVASDPRLTDVWALKQRYPRVRMLGGEGLHTPLELASLAIRESTGDVVLLTEDHCVPKPDWVRRLCEAQQPQHAAVGGTIESDDDVSNVDWAFYFVDFYRYSRPVPAGPSSHLSVCNVAYRRACLEEIRSVWKPCFHETAVHAALHDRFGPLWMAPEAEVRMRRHVRLAAAVYERYAFGRLFGCTRLESARRARRICCIAFGPVLPILLLGRMVKTALLRRRLWGPFVGALPAVTAMVLAWSLGEWLGYVTRRPPRSLGVAQEIAD